MSTEPSHPTQFIWATRGRSWGFRFLVDAGFDDPLPEYERAFAGLADHHTTWHREDGRLALRFPDPPGRRDAAGRVIPHEFVVFDDPAGHTRSVDDGIQRIWPLVEHVYARIWDSDNAPTANDLRLDE